MKRKWLGRLGWLPLLGVWSLFLPLWQVKGESMVPTLQEGEVVLSVAGFSQGDLVVFSQGDSLLVKRCIAGPGQWVDILADGTVMVDGEALEEPYVQGKAYGHCDIPLPCQVPQGCWFCMGDNRAVSADSRLEEIGCVAEERIVGKLWVRIWPLKSWGWLG